MSGHWTILVIAVLLDELALQQSFQDNIPRQYCGIILSHRSPQRNSSPTAPLREVWSKLIQELDQRHAICDRGFHYSLVPAQTNGIEVGDQQCL